MSFLNKKAVTIALPLLISLIIFALVIVIDVVLFSSARDAASDSEFGDCKYSIDISQGLKLQKSILGIKVQVQPIPIECTPLIIDSELFEDVNDAEEVAIVILNKARIAWWATGRGEYTDIWKDSGKPDRLCKFMYYFELEKNNDKLKSALGSGFTERMFIHYLETSKLPKIDASLYDYLLYGSGLGNRYHVLFDNNKLELGEVYGIAISSRPDASNEIIFTNVPEGKTLDEVKDIINDKFTQKNPGANGKLCEEILDFNDNRVRIFP